ncbi:AI-2E family transporter [Natrarchaeobaculum aegyptiacum]|uniref:AI-2E family transporter n=1 Tax=Natrarchaeobaculum aegyptiacum TaxID=745377 RepID=A0A2Z2HWT1_9EURY|nr:AI-2E family transporter [Natrarchaeobaculum aegyptiacum]ARS91323.1 AI-2E family transporter [Natrarchaeobaculum aegyptiacum]
MADSGDEPGWISDRTAMTAIAIVSAILGLFVVLPYLQYVLLGVVLAYVLMPAQRRLERYVGSMMAAGVLVVVAVSMILLPLAYVLAIALREALEVLTALQEGSLDVRTFEDRFEDTGYEVDLVEMYQTYEGPITSGLQGIATSAIEIVSGLPIIAIGLTVTLFVLFALLRDGDALVAWFGHVLPIADDLQEELFAELDRLMWASVVGNVAVAAIQAIALGVGLAILDVPTVVFLTVATFVLALLPLVGAFGVWIPVTVYLLAIGRPVAALLLVLYGSLVSASDTYLRPALIGRTTAFNAAIVVVGIFGGIVVFGAIGLFIGPVVLGGAKVTLDVFARERARSEDGDRRTITPAREPAVDTDPETGIRSGVGANGVRATRDVGWSLSDLRARRGGLRPRIEREADPESGDQPEGDPDSQRDSDAPESDDGTDDAR